MKTRQEPKIVSVFVPFKLTKRGGRKEMILPPANELSRPRHDNTVLKALARAFRWKRMLEEGSYASITELAEQEKIGMSYLTRVMRMTLLAPVHTSRRFSLPATLLSPSTRSLTAA